MAKKKSSPSVSFETYLVLFLSLIHIFPFLVLAAELLQRYRPVRFQNIFPDSRFTPKGKFRSRKGLLHDSIRPDAFRCFYTFPVIR